MGRQWDSPPPFPRYLPVCRGDGRCSDGAVRLQLQLLAGTPPVWPWRGAWPGCFVGTYVGSMLPT
eukprot:scaffold4978_cov117-Isochrysis_galbana.AAC.8